MTITPMDIQNKEFERAFRGYDIEDVDDFLDQVAKDLEILLRENTELKDQVGQLQDKNKNYQKLEDTMHNAILVAQETAEEVKLNAKREADLIRREAERESNQIVEDARFRSTKIMGEQEELFKQAQLFKMRFRSFIEAQLANLESEDWLDERKKEEPADKMESEFEPTMNFEIKEVADLEEETELEPELEYEPDPDFKLGPDDDFDSDPEF